MCGLYFLSMLSNVKILENIEVDSISSDYAIPPDAMSENEVPPVVESVIPAVLLRSSFVDSPVKRVEVSEKVN